MGWGSGGPSLVRRHKKEQGGAQWSGLRASTAGGMGSIPGRGTEILHDSDTLTYTHPSDRAEKKNGVLVPTCEQVPSAPFIQYAGCTPQFYKYRFHYYSALL